MQKLNYILTSSLLAVCSLVEPALADQPIFQAPTATAPASNLPYCSGTTTAAPVVNGIQSASQPCQPLPTTAPSTAGVPQPSSGTPYATTNQMLGGVSWGESLATQHSANPMSSSGGTSTSFNASPIGSSPADASGSATVGYQATANYSLVMACNKNPAVPNQKAYSAGGVSLAVGACTVSGSGKTAQVTSMNIAACSNTVNGGTCSTADYMYSTFYAGQMQDLNGASAAALVVSCPADGSLTCQVNVQTISNLQVSGNNLKSAGSAASNTNPEVQMLSSPLTGASAPVIAGLNHETSNGSASAGMYNATVQNWAGANAGYYAKTESQLSSPTASGGITVTTWDGQKSANLNSSNCPPPTRQCAQYATTKNNWNESCNSDVPVTKQSCTTVTPTQNCTVTDPTTTYSCSDALTVAVKEVPGCVPGTSLGTASTETCPRCWDPWAVTQVTCAADGRGYNVAWGTSSCKGSDWGTSRSCPANNWFRGSAIISTNIAGAAGVNIPSTKVGTWGYRCSGTTYFSQSCDSTGCTLTQTISSNCRMGSFTASSSYPLPIQLTYTDSWNDGCTPYENAH